MNSMKAIAKKSGRIDDFALMEVPVPRLGENELLVRVKAIGVGIHDGYFLPEHIRYPYPIGIEAAGIIEQTGKSVTRFRVGERIAFVSSMQPKGGTWAEFAAVTDDSLILPIPENMTFEQAAAVPVAGNTALKALHALDLQQNETLFIAGASGAIGTFAIQLAKAKGCIVAGSASAHNHEYMQSLGALKTVDYHDADWIQQIREWIPGGADAAMAIQPGTGIESMKILKDGGRVVAVSGDRLPDDRAVSIRNLAYHVDVTNELLEMMHGISEGRFQLFIEQTYPFSEALSALQKTTTRRARGKLVITGP
ncbi:MULTISPECIES: NADP-dependent oxidoreductase [unclassified Sporosarcina]|uniref:NADP-dependent oxidoreductase n=1 Tax=unclassified Sporosarcina TaxID=2647733 RepID=UPI00203FABC5|nr:MULTISPECIES: NADP-dependent oxidoreductase [unclassified Sporosarcina]GKV65557.1 NADPH:quinone reductase [Sporosarcina sp. NCCP-2331]GLB55682.1 NADPH:quinone reductase [Sporosarcina sp. NCCP-2378]